MRLNGWTTKVKWIDTRHGNIFVSSPVHSHRKRALSASHSTANRDSFQGVPMTTLLHLGSKFRTRGVIPPVSHMSYGVHGKNFYLYLHTRSPHSRKVTPLRTPATWHVSEQNPHTSCILRRLPDMHLAGESLARRLTTPLCQGRLTDQYTLAGGRSLGALLFYMSSPGRTFETRLHRNSVSRPHSVLSMNFTSPERGHQDEKHELKQPISKHKLLLRKL